MATKHANLTITHPKLAKEWHPTKNGDLTPDMVTGGSEKKVWWICELGHEWQAQISNRTYGETGCPYCSQNKVVKGVNDLATVNPELAKEWHPTKNGDLTPDMVTGCSGKKVWWMCKHGHEWEAQISSRKFGTGCPYCHEKKAIKNHTDLATTHPDIAKQWHPTKNGDLMPDMVTHGSKKKVWWMCEHGHEWQSFIFNRTTKSGCPYCSGYNATKGTNDLATTHPELAKEWHPTKNGDLTPDMITSGSNKKIWWMCEHGHEWQSSVLSRKKGHKCPSCAKKNYTRKNHCDLATERPDLAAQWHPTKNGNLTPKMVTCGSDKKAWWICEHGHEWEARISNRKNGRNCPFCAGQKITKGINDLATINPKLAKEWHPTKNGDLTPEMVTAGSNKKVWWICEHGHEWEAKILSRKDGSGCPYCFGAKVLKGFNDLATVHPDLAKEWHPTKNGNLTPDMVTSGSNKRVWWMCKHGHEWITYIKNRTKGTICPRCSVQQRTKKCKI